MTYQDEIINQLMRDYEESVINHERSSSLLSAQRLAKARQSLMDFIKEARKNAQ